ncbi:MAG: aspartate/glutamate racemase family protein [Pseudomonadota bacterium]
MEPVEFAVAKLWPEVEAISMLDESLEIDRATSAGLGSDLQARIMTLAKHAAGFGADGVLFTCSAFGPAIEAANEEVPIPVIKPNEAMFHAALSIGARIAMIHTFKPAAPGMVAEFEALCANSKTGSSLDSFFCDGAMAAKCRGDIDVHDQLIAECGAALTGYDAILLAQFSMASAAERLRRETNVPVLTSPDSAVREMRRRVEAVKPHAEKC